MTPVRILITGALGYVGQHLCQALLTQGVVELHGTYRNLRPHSLAGKVKLHQVDLADKGATKRMVEAVVARQVYHLAGNIRAGRGRDVDQQAADRDNVQSTNHLFQACLGLPERPRVVFASTGAVYGDPGEIITETSSMKPLNAYAVSKAEADQACVRFGEAGLPIIRARLFNYLGSGQDEQTALSRFAHELARLERDSGKLPAVLTVGDLSAERDFTDIADAICAFILLMERGRPGEAYNVASGVSHPMHWYLAEMLKHVRIPVEVRLDPSQVRHQEAKRLQVDVSKLQNETGWKPSVPIRQSLFALLESARAKVASPCQPE